MAIEARESASRGVSGLSCRAAVWMRLRPALCDQVNRWPGRRRRRPGRRRCDVRLLCGRCRLLGACSSRASCSSHERSVGVGSAPASSASRRASSRLANSSAFGSGTAMLDVPTGGWSAGRRQAGAGTQAGAGALGCFAGAPRGAVVRVGCETPPPVRVSGPVEAEGSPILELRVRMASSPVNEVSCGDRRAVRAQQARRDGVTRVNQ
jgi:hypothetical protein